MKPNYGVDLSRYMLIPRVLIIATHGDEILVIRRAAHKKLWPGVVNAPGGHVEVGEDPLQAARRELWEETGIEATKLDLRGMLITDSEQPGVGILVFIFRAEVEDTQLTASSEGTPLWLSRNALANETILPDFPLLLSLCLDQPAFFYVHKRAEEDGSEEIKVRLDSNMSLAATELL
ncbi:MAG: NUDIX domain-containing protein [Chloroflexi bacterium]|nr:NUDIX domain-containing protein [Chloroflexota bacterium]